MQRIILPFFLVALAIAVLAVAPARAAAKPEPPSIAVDADGKVLATPDLATLTLEVETQAATATAAGQQNAKTAAQVLKALKKDLGPKDHVRTLGYRLVPVYSSPKKSAPPAVKAYRAVNRIEVKVVDVNRLGAVIDTALKSGTSRINGPYWSFSRIEELQRQAAVDAFNRARSMAEAVAQAAGVKIKGVEQISTGLRFIGPRVLRAEYKKSLAAPATPVEPGEEAIRAHVQVVFLLSR
jgi:uncharacterized protein YggE